MFISQREELAKLKIGGTLNQHLDGLSKSYMVPKLSTFLDLGSQGFDWKFNDKTRYYIFGVSMQWAIFSSGKNYFKTKQVQLDSKIIQSQTDYVTSQIQMQYTTSVNNFNASISTYQGAISTFNASQKYYTDMLRMWSSTIYRAA